MIVCEQMNFGFRNNGEFLDQLSNYQLFKEYRGP